MAHLSTFVRRAAASVAGAVLLLTLGAPAALAHDRLKSSSPADNAKLDRVETIELEFSSRMTMPTILLEGPDGDRVPLAKPRMQGVKLLTSLERELQAGRHRIAWRVVSSDGHPIQGELHFTVTARPTPAATSSADAPTTPAEPSASGETSAPEGTSAPGSSLPDISSPPSTAEAAPVAGSGDGMPAWLWIAAGVLVLAGVGIFLGGRRKSGSGGT
ncbi:hypothetical protein HII36_10965 [Nonomuraea sp. NN258]|uniref:copper resistance CopC family protein n=1 Tax=Nonomuraea antri TaxID=2730852 RepID=UPI00156901AD|nr:copper resistance protein CopC [Nonomuraea antri]NRQ32355.1 hypothetical protein [Nonomuraea antri]